MDQSHREVRKSRRQLGGCIIACGVFSGKWKVLVEVSAGSGSDGLHGRNGK